MKRPRVAVTLTVNRLGQTYFGSILVDNRPCGGYPSHACYLENFVDFKDRVKALGLEPGRYVVRVRLVNRPSWDAWCNTWICKDWADRLGLPHDVRLFAYPMEVRSLP